MEIPILNEHLTMLPDAASAEAMEMIERLRSSVVQIRGEGRGVGAGVIWRADGSILTNNHVVAHLTGAPQVMLTDGRHFPAAVVDTNPTLDLALLKIQAQGLPAVDAGDSARLRVGEMVFAIGHPWGQRGVVTAGIVSGLGTVPASDGSFAFQFIRSDVYLRPGNSGGPLINAQGEVVGINAMVFGGDLSVAIPSHVAITWLKGRQGRQIHLGVFLQPVELPAKLRQGPLDGREVGLLVIGLETGGLAEGSGLLVGDVLLDVAGETIEDAEALRQALVQSPTVQSLTLRVLRGGQITDLNVKLDPVEDPG